MFDTGKPAFAALLARSLLPCSTATKHQRRIAEQNITWNDLRGELAEQPEQLDIESRMAYEHRLVLQKWDAGNALVGYPESSAAPSAEQIKHWIRYLAYS